MSRFAPLSEPKPASRFANLSERLNAPLPGEPLHRDGDFDAPLGAKSKRLEAYRERTAGTSPAAVRKASTAPKPTVALKPTAAELAAKAKADAGAKVATVTAASAYKGREATARKLLLEGKQSAVEIVKTLAASPTDAQLAAVDRHLNAKAADNIWAKAYGVTRAPKCLCRGA